MFISSFIHAFIYVKTNSMQYVNLTIDKFHIQRTCTSMDRWIQINENENGHMVPLILNPSPTTWKCLVRLQHQLLYPSVKLLKRRLETPHAGMYTLWNLLPLPETELQCLSHPTCMLFTILTTLYWLANSEIVIIGICLTKLGMNLTTVLWKVKILTSFCVI